MVFSWDKGSPKSSIPPGILHFHGTFPNINYPAMGYPHDYGNLQIINPMIHDQLGPHVGGSVRTHQLGSSSHDAAHKKKTHMSIIWITLNQAWLLKPYTIKTSHQNSQKINEKWPLDTSLGPPTQMHFQGGRLHQPHGHGFNKTWPRPRTCWENVNIVESYAVKSACNDNVYSWIR